MARLIGAGEFATEGERKAADALKTLPEPWVVICNKLLVADSRRSFEIDFIVLADRNVFVIDEKSWSGRITGTDQVWVRVDGSSANSPISKMDYIARVVRGYLEAKVPLIRSLPGHFVHGSVVLSQADRVPQLRDPRASTAVFLLSDVADRLKELDKQNGTDLIGVNRAAIEAKLVDLSPRPRVPKVVGFYTIIESSESRPGVRVMTADLPGAGPRSLLVYELSPLQDMEFLMREFRALQALRPTGLVPEVGDPFPWSDSYLVLPLNPPRGRSLSSLAVKFERQTMLVELRLAAVAFAGLAQIHARHVLHRSLDPHSVFAEIEGDSLLVSFTNFYAARVGSHTIAAQLDELQALEPYCAPEIAKVGYGFATETTDVYSLALVFLERFTGKPLAELPRGRGLTADLFGQWSLLGQDVPPQLHALFRAATGEGEMAGVGSDQTVRPEAQDLADQLHEIYNAIRGLGQAGGPGRVFDERYEVERLLGQGANAITYLVKDLEFGQYFAVKQFRRPSAVYQQAKAEFDALRHITSRNLPRVYDIYPPQNDVHLKLDYIQGPSVEELRTEFPWPLDRWIELARGLLEAVAELERHALLHRDVKPANVVIRDEDGQPVLVDFGFAIQAGGAAPAAGTPIYWPPETLRASEPPRSCDRYALAVLLHLALTGALPFEIRDSQFDQGTLRENTATGVERRLIDVLNRALAPDPDARFGTAYEFRQAVDGALLLPDELDTRGDLPELVNPWVDEIRGTYRNSRIGNADNRGLDSEFARSTYVETALDRRLVPELLRNKPLAVFLSGNPGDGKTAFLEKLKTRIVSEGGKVISEDASGWVVRLGGHTFAACYDASEARGAQTADDQLEEKLRTLAGERQPADLYSVVIAINDGRLSDFLNRNYERFAWLTRNVERARPEWIARDPVWVIDLKRRSLMSPESGTPSVFSGLLGSLVDPARWALCNGCASRDICPMKRNALDLGEADSAPEVRNRLEHLLLLAQLRQVKHTTIRDLRSTLSFLITADTSCAEVHEERRGERPPNGILRSFWQSLFDGRATDGNLETALAGLDPGDTTTPQLDAFLSFHRWLDDAAERRELFVDAADLSPRGFGSTGAWMRAFKRRLFFKSGSASASLVPNWSDLLPYRHAGQFLRAVMSPEGRLDALPKLAAGISQSEGLTEEVTNGAVCLRVAASDVERLSVVKRFPLSRFRLVAASAESLIEATPHVLRLEFDGGPAVEIGLDHFELLMRMSEGLRPNAIEFVAPLAELAAFKSALLLHETREVAVMEGEARLYSVGQTNDRVILKT